MIARVRRIATVWLPVAAWCALIYWLSGRPDMDLNHLAPGWPSLWWLDTPLRKGAHAFEYCVLFLLARRGWPAAPAWLFCVAYAATDEWHQTLVPGRAGRVSDVLLDAAAAALPWALVRVKTVFRRG
jgi:hypothetical protein